MFILRDITQPLQAHFSDTRLGQRRASLFVYTLLSIIIPFTSSITSNCLRCLVTLFGIEIEDKRFYTFMASTTLPWRRLWQTVWRLIPSPETDGRLLVALDDSLNPKIGKNIFGCDTIFDVRCEVAPVIVSTRKRQETRCSFNGSLPMQGKLATAYSEAIGTT